MQYRTYKFKELDTPWYWTFPNADGSTGTYINKDTLVYASGGAVSNYSIDQDYMVANNSTLEIAQETKAVAGQIIVLIDDSGAYDLGVVTSVDNENLKILYKSMMALLDTDILNPTRDGLGETSDSEDEEPPEISAYLYDGVDGTARILAAYFATNGVDKYRRLPIFVRTSGGGIDKIRTERVTETITKSAVATSSTLTIRVDGLEPFDDITVTGVTSWGYNKSMGWCSADFSNCTVGRTYTVTFKLIRNVTVGDNKPYASALWNYKDNTVNVREWLMDLFDKHNVVVQFSLVFETTERAYIEIYIQRNTAPGRLLKNNIHGLTVKHTEESGARATVCQVINQETKEWLSTWYLLDDNTVTQDATAENRIQPYMLTVAEFDTENDGGATQKEAAEEAMLYSDFNHYINISMDRTSAMFPKNLSIGDAVTIVPELQEMGLEDEINDEYEDKVYKSIYTGRKESSSSSEVTLIFGKIRINYTDIIQMQQAKKVRT